MAGARDKLVTFYAPGAEGARDAFNNPTTGEPVELGTSWASFEELTDREKIEAGQEVSATIARLIVRSNPVVRALTGEHIASIEGASWAVAGTVESAGSRRGHVAVQVVRKNGD